MLETNTDKMEQMSHKVLIRPDLPLEMLPSDPIIFDLVLFYLYDESTRMISNNEISVKIALVSYEKYGSIEEFKSLAYQKYKAILDMLCKHEIINSYNMEYASKAGLRKKWIQKDYVMDKVTIPYYLAECRFNPTKLQAYVKKRFARSKSYFEELTQVYSRIIKIIEEFFAEPIISDAQLNRFYKSLVNKLRELFEQNILPYLYIQMALPFDDLLFEQYQIQEIKQNLSKYIDPLQDNYAHLQQLIGMYDLDEKKDTGFNEMDEYLVNLEAERQKPNHAINPIPIKIIEAVEMKLKTEADKNILVEKTKLREGKLVFDDDTHRLTMDEMICILPAYKNEHYFCREMFKYDTNVAVDWSEVYEAMTGSNHLDRENSWRTLYDAVMAVNDRVKRDFNTDNQLFTWKDKTITRNY